MKSAPITLPPHCAQRVGAEIATRIVGVGETVLLAEPLFGLMVSHECPGHVLLETLDRVPEWVKAGRVIVSGFRSPLEQQVLVAPSNEYHIPYLSPDSPFRALLQTVALGNET